MERRRTDVNALLDDLRALDDIGRRVLSLLT